MGCGNSHHKSSRCILLESNGASLRLTNVGIPVQHVTLVQVAQRDLLEDRNPSRVSLKWTASSRIRLTSRFLDLYCRKDCELLWNLQAKNCRYIYSRLYFLCPYSLMKTSNQQSSVWWMILITVRHSAPANIDVVGCKQFRLQCEPF
jgi:hypothetical protein